MYRIEVSPGEETVFRTVEELATGIRNGVLTSRSRIYHGASAKWLPIEFHPHYKQAVELAAHPPSVVDQSHHIPVPNSTPAWRRSAPAPAPEPAPAPPVARPSPISTPAPEPELVLPRISYPEVPQPEPPSEQPLFKSRRRMGGRPLMLAAAVLVVAVGARFMLAAAPLVEEPELPTTTLGSSPAPVPEVKPAPRPRPKPAPRPEPKAAAAPVATSTPLAKPIAAPAPATTPASAPKLSAAPEPTRVPPPSRLEPLKNTVPGPAFAPALPAGSVPASAAVRLPAPAKAPAPSADSAAPAAPAIEPAPVQIDLSLPGSLPSTDSISVISKSADSNAMRRILKAVSGKKAQPTKVETR